MRRIESSEGLTRLDIETIESDGMVCTDCGGLDKASKLKVYATVRGNNRRTHNGQFCSKLCHDLYHELRPRKST